MATTTPVFTSGITLPIERIATLCRKYDVEELAVFGSILRDDFGPESDVDFLVDFKNDDYGPWLGKLTDLEADLTALLGRPVELVPKEMLKWVVRDRILNSARVLYEDRRPLPG